MKILVTGDRNWRIQNANQALAIQHILALHMGDTLIHGYARGVDTIADHIGLEIGMIVRRYPAEWTKYNRAAGPIRNQQMLAENPDIEIVYAFHDNISESRGTKDMLTRAVRFGIPKIYLTNSNGKTVEWLTAIPLF